MEYMVNCKYSEAAGSCGHPVDSHCVILVSRGSTATSLCYHEVRCLLTNELQKTCSRFAELEHLA